MFTVTSAPVAQKEIEFLLEPTSLVVTPVVSPRHCSLLDGSTAAVIIVGGANASGLSFPCFSVESNLE